MPSNVLQLSTVHVEVEGHICEGVCMSARCVYVTLNVLT